MRSSKQVSEDLVRALSDVDSLKSPEEIAEELLERDCQVFSLIGLYDGASRAVFYDWPIWAVRDIPMMDEGLDGLTSNQSVAIHHYDRVETYIEECGLTYWDWLHPRYRWIFSTEGPQELTV